MTLLKDIALSEDERLVLESLLNAQSAAANECVSTAHADAAIAAFERIVLDADLGADGQRARKPDYRNIATEMYEHIIFIHGYMLGLTMRAGSSGHQAWAETKPMRDNAVRLAELAGLPIPDYFRDRDPVVGGDEP